MFLMEQFLLPPWLHDFVKLEYFTVCNEHIHRGARDSSRKYYCVDCGRGPLCQKICQVEHRGHKVLQVRKFNQKSGVSVDDIAKLVNIKHIRTYSFTDRATVVFLASKSQATPTCSLNCCEMCNFSLPDFFRFCSLSCKIKAKINPSGIISSAPKRPGEAVEIPVEISSEDNDEIGEMQLTDSNESYEERNTASDEDSTSSDSDGETSLLVPEAVNISAKTARKRKSVSSGYAPDADVDADAGLAARKAAALAKEGIASRTRSHGWTKTGGIGTNSYVDSHDSNSCSQTEHKAEEKRKDCSEGSENDLENLDIDTKLKDSIYYFNDSMVAFGDMTVSIYLLRLLFSKEIHFAGKQMYVTLSEKDVSLEKSIKARSHWAGGVKPDRFLSWSQQQQEDMKIRVKDTLRRELEVSKIGLETVCQKIDVTITDNLEKAKKDVDLAIERLTEHVERTAVEAIERDLADLEGAFSAAIDISLAVTMCISLMRQWFSREKESFRNQIRITLSDEELHQKHVFRQICRQIYLPRLYWTRENLETFKRNLRNDSLELSTRIQNDLQTIADDITQNLPKAKSNAELELESVAEAVEKAVDAITCRKPNSKGQ